MKLQGSKEAVSKSETIIYFYFPQNVSSMEPEQSVRLGALFQAPALEFSKLTDYMDLLLGLHSVVLTSIGQLFMWGYGGFGALRHSVYFRELLPRLVKAIEN